MSFVEIIGFGISLLALLFLFFHNQKSSSQQEGQDNQEEPLAGDPIQTLLIAMDKERKKREAPPSPPIYLAPKRKMEQDKRGEERKRKGQEPQVLRRPNERQSHEQPLSKPKKDLYSSSLHGEDVVRQTPRIRHVLNHLGRLNNIVIFKEILDKPKSLRPWE